MTPDQRGLDIEDSESYSRKEAVGERMGWAVMAALVGAALLGLLANGPLSHRVLQSEHLKLQYQRFGRNHGLTTLTVEAPAAAATGGTVEVWVSQDFLDSYELEDVHPDPESTSTRAGGVVFAFAVEGTDTPVKATLRLRPEHTGRQHGAVAVGPGPPTRFSQFVYP